MQFVFYAIAALLLFAVYPYLIAYGVMLKTTLRCIRIEATSLNQMPEHLNTAFQPAIAELEQYGFRVSGHHLIELGTIRDGKRWGILLQNMSQKIHATLTICEPLNAANPLNLMFSTFFADGCQLVTTNSRFYGIYSQNPKEIVQSLETATIGEQRQAHQRKLEQLSTMQTPRPLSPEAFIVTVEAYNKADVERLIKNGEVYWVQPGETYRLNWWTTLKAVFKVARRQGQTERSSQSQQHGAANEIPPVASAIELEVDEFRRWQQRQQGFSRRAKSWLLLGTLALFITIYSSVFEPQRLVIFVAALLLHEGGHVLAMKQFGYRDATMLFVPFLGALATARKENASLTEKVWISLAGPLPGLLLGIGLAISFSLLNADRASISTWFGEFNWIREATWMLIGLNLFNLLPIYPLDGGQVADLLLFSRHPYLGVLFKGIGVLLLGLLGLQQPLLLIFAIAIGATIPSSFRLAKLNTALRKELRSIPLGDREGLVRFIFGKLQTSPYHSLSFAQKYGLVLGLLESHQEGAAKWTTRVGLSGIYFASLLVGIGGGLYALMPDWTLWTTAVSYYLQDPVVAYQTRMKQKIERANQMLQANPKDVEAYLQRGRARLSLKDYAGSMADANQVLQLSPNSSQGYELRSRLRLQMSDIKEAEADRVKARHFALTERIEQMDRTLRKNPKDVNAYLKRASARAELGDRKGAIADCNQVLQLDFRNISALLNRSDAYLQLKDYNRAIADANQVLSIQPDVVEAYDLRSKARHHLGDETGAISDAQKAEALYQAQTTAEN